MADNVSAATATTLPPPPQSSTVPSNQQYDASQGNGQANPSHMPPPPRPPVVIPQNTNPIPTAITSPMSGNMMSPTSAGGFVRRAAPEPNKRALYVGGLDPRVTEDILKQIFETTGHVVSVKIIPDKNKFNSKGYNYGFVEFDDPGAAERAMQTLNGRRIHQSEIRVNWAYQSNNTNKEDTSSHFHIFVGDLSNEVNDEVLMQAFSAFGSVSEARVMWDMKTGRSRGYGFVAFRDRTDADKALNAMDGEWLGSRAIRCNWANQKGQPSISQQQAMAAMGMTPANQYGGHHNFPTHGIQSYDMVVGQTAQWQTTCYVGNLTPYTTQNDLVPLFQNFGYVLETRLQADRGFAFIKMDTHENAAMAICQLNGYNVNGRPLKCSWGKDRPPTGQFDNFSGQQASSPFNSSPTPYFPQYGGPGGPMTPQGPNPAGRGWDQSGMGGQGYGQVPGNAGYGRGQGAPASGWNQPNNANFGNGFVCTCSRRPPAPMEDAGNSKGAALSLDDNDRLAGRMRSGSASSGHKRTTSGSLLSRLSFLRMIQATQNTAERTHSGLERDDGADELTAGLRGGRAMSNAIQQHRRTRRRRGSLRKTALLGTRLDYRDKKPASVPADVLRGDNGAGSEQQQQQSSSRPGSSPTVLPTSSATTSANPRMRYFVGPVSRADNEITSPGTLGSFVGDETDTAWTLMDAPQRARTAASTAAAHRQSSPAKNSLLGIGDEMTTDEEEIISFPRSSTSTSLHPPSASGATGLRLPTAASTSDSYYSLQTDPTYRSLHRAKSPLATHAVDIATSAQMVWDYSETEWWGWIILIVTWLVFVVGMGSCFGVWSWAWDVGETPYAPPELEDDPTLPIVGYYPALIILTAVMSWVWVVVAWVGMKYFKHANISGEDI
ncbi:nuclear and cytoplasmic polyadenylated RNA-binding protein pub1 [Aspergillus saccharolyticus JOP 1030-1]|uniref:RRM domain-containing protein n=1 Tax=Aspergillus saccharolyticus JOP 1030-1 TaxID=1450539 RepID=A0A318ZFN3_9EURO|nr:hypothetical protein BP01DRAFT_373320 [Aspergillus saccharolyticus JOP 1030-1]PYH46361.1 hypothetical protein BP01DRAFT_373320 [Aspergillus saccharolyticus JOP 1030-1]